MVYLTVVALSPSHTLETDPSAVEDILPDQVPGPITCLREAAKKSYSSDGQAIKRGRGNGRAIKEKFCNLKINHILLKSTYQNINTANVGKVVVF